MNHKKWITILDYFEKPEVHKNKIDELLSKDKNILLMIMKKEGEDKKRREKVFNKFCEIYPSETLNVNKKIIISTVPDIEEVIKGDTNE